MILSSVAFSLRFTWFPSAEWLFKIAFVNNGSTRSFYRASVTPIILASHEDAVRASSPFPMLTTTLTPKTTRICLRYMFRFP